MKSLVLKPFAHGCFFEGALSEQGLEETQALGDKLGGLYRGKLVGFFSAKADICQKTAQEIASAMGKNSKPQIMETLGRRSGFLPYLEGIGPHLPQGIDVAVCVTNADVIARVRKCMGDFNTDTSLRDEHHVQIHPFPNGRWVG